MREGAVATSTPGDPVVQVTPSHRSSRAARRPPGFRFSAADAAVLAAGAAATWLTWGVLGQMALLLPVVLLHFFLVCNVFRTRRSYELIWAMMFIVNVAAWQLADAMSWKSVLAVQLPVTLLVIAAEIRSRRYHGVGWRWINPSCCLRQSAAEEPS